MTGRLYHNPGCSKSRAALALLAESGAPFETVRYLDQPPSVDDLMAILDRLVGTPASLLRSDDAAAAGLDREAADLDDAAAVAGLLAANPHLMQRPLFVTDDVAIIGRPPERVLDAL